MRIIIRVFFIISIIIFMYNNLNSNSELIAIDKSIGDIDNDSINDIIIVLGNKETGERILNIYLSTISLNSPTIINKTAIPNPILDALLCDEIYIDSVGFSFSMESTNGNNYKSRIFYFKMLKKDIVLYKIEENNLYNSNFEQNNCTTFFDYDNVKKYDSTYSIHYFNFNEFW